MECVLVGNSVPHKDTFYPLWVKSVSQEGIIRKLKQLTRFQFSNPKFKNNNKKHKAVTNILLPSSSL